MNSAPHTIGEKDGAEPVDERPVDEKLVDKRPVDKSPGDNEPGDSLLLFDAGCPFCRRSVRWLLAHERDDSRLRIVGLNSDVSRRLGEHFEIDFAATDSIWYIVEGRLSRNSGAVWRLATRLRGAWRCFSVLRWVPRPLRDGVYRFVGDHRHRLSWLGGERLEGHERWVDALTPTLCRQFGLPSELANP